MTEYQETYLDLIDLAHRLGVSQSAVVKWSRPDRGILPPPVRIGRCRRWYWPDVVRAIRARAEAKRAAHRAAIDAARRSTQTPTDGTPTTPNA